MMDGWRLRAPLLHGPQPERPATDPGSSASIPREVVQEEVRRQVQEALESQRRHMQELIEENRRLRGDAAFQDRRHEAVFVDNDGGLPVPTQVPQGRRALEQSLSQGVPEADPPGVREGLGVPQGHRAAGQQYSASVPEADPPGVREGLGVPQGHRAVGQQYNARVPGVDPTGVRDGLGVPQGHRAFDQGYSSGLPGADPTAVRDGLGVPQGHRTFDQGYSSGLPGADPTGVRDGRGVPQGHRAYEQATSAGVPEADPAGVREGLGVPQGHRAYDQTGGFSVPEADPAGVREGLGVPQGHRAYDQSSGFSVPRVDPAGVREGLGVPQGHRASDQGGGFSVPRVDPAGVREGLGVPQGHQPYFSQDSKTLGGSPQARREGRVRSLSQEPRGGGQTAARYPGQRTSSVDRKSSPLARMPYGESSSTARFGGTRRFSFRGQGDDSGFLHGGLGVLPSETAYRPPGFRDSRTYGDYGFERPPGLDARTDGPIPELPRDPVPVGDDGRRQETGVPAGGSTGPSAMDVLITGMGQLQQVLLRKNDIVDLEPKAVSELVKLPEYTAETGAIDFQDYLYLAEQQIGTLASGAGDWWSRTLSVAQQAYAEYQTLSPVRRLNVVPHLTEDLRDDKYKKLERKVAALVLASLPKGVRDDLVAYRVQGVHHILYRLMVIFQPGGAQDRAQLLKQLDVTESAQGPAEATTALRRWYRLLQRASDLGVKLPDESLQVRALSVIVKKTSEQNADFKFRLALARTELQIDTRPTQENVLRYLQHLLAELEQLGAVTRKASSATAAASSTTIPGAGAATTTTTGGASLKGLAPVPDAKAKAKSIPAKKVCSWFGTDSGCRNGKACNFQHQWAGLNRGERCLLCGSKQHRAKECPTATPTSTTEKPQSPARAAKLQSSSSATTPTQPQVVDQGSSQGEGSSTGASGAAASVASGAHNKIDAAKVTEILSETNKMLKALATPQQPPKEAAPAPLDPIEMIQKQLDEVRRLRTLVVRAPEEPSPAFSSAVSWYETRLQATAVAPTGGEEEDEALLDSGASHAFRPPVSQEELLESRRVGVSLATGEERRLPQNPGGTLLSEDGRDATILPMGQLVTLLGCRVSWTPSKLTVVHPVHGKLQVRLRGHCPVLPVTQALSLISELEQKRMESFEKTVQDLQLQVKALKEKGMQGWSWEQHLRAFAEQGDRTHLAGLLHKNPVFSTVKAEALLGVPEDVPLGSRDGWNLLKGMPWSRAKRKAMHQSDGWVVHLFSGDERAERGKSRLEMKKSFWSDALTGNDVLVEVDVTTSRSLDLLQRDGVFRVLAWGALTGRIKAIVGGPPRQTFPTTADGLVNGAQHQREVQLVVRMMTLYYLAQQGRTLRWHNGGLKSMVKPHVGFLLEHPYTREGGLVSLFQMPLWKMFALDNMMGEVPCVMNERNVVLGGNLNLWHLRDERLGLRESVELGSVWPFELTTQVAGAIRSWVGLRNHESLLASLMRTSWVQDGEAANLNKFNAHDWRLHVQRDHLPYRRDCRECIERASGKPHRKVGHPTPCTLSIDTAGPFRTKGAGGYKYLLAIGWLLSTPDPEGHLS